ncbi:MAG: hypothetical protein ACOYXC_14690 [Candidatus Rifleibacteriota bacterium]
MPNKLSAIAFFKKKSGSLYLLVVFIIVSVSVLAGKFFQISRQQQSSSFRLEQNLLAREIAESAHNEAYAQIVNQTTDRESDLAKWLAAKNNHDIYQLDLPATESIKPQLLKPNFSAEIKCELKKIDFRSNSHELIDYSPLDQGQGTLAIKIEIEIFHGLINAKKLLSASLTRHHDYLVAAMVSRRNNSSARTDYSQSFPLDYALLVRDGLKEFREYSGNVLNDENNFLTIDQEALTPENCGKIYFGGADAGNHQLGDMPPLGNYVFLNIDEKNLNAIPNSPTDKVTIDMYEILELVPELNNSLNLLQDNTTTIQGVSGVFKITTGPTFRSIYSGLEQKIEKKCLDKLQQISAFADANTTPFSLTVGSKTKVSNAQFLRACLEGSIRKRFLYLVHFYIDLSNATVTYNHELNGLTTEPVKQDEIDRLTVFENRILCLPNLPGAADTPENEHFLQVLNDKYAEKNGVSLISQLNASHPFSLTPGSLNSPDQDFPTPVFFNRQNGPVSSFSTGANGFQAYGNFELWSRRRLKRDDLVRLKIIDFDKKIIRPRGIIHTAEADGLTFDAGEWKIEGCGVLIAPKFSIAGSISKSTDKDMLVLLARKEGIEVTTDQRIESALIAVNDDLTGCVTVLKNLDLKGAIIADRLNLALWNPGSHKIEYDPAFKLKDKDVYITSLSRWTTFQAWKIN